MKKLSLKNKVLCPICASKLLWENNAQRSIAVDVSCSHCKAVFEYRYGILDLSLPTYENKTNQALNSYDSFWAASNENGVLSYSASENYICNMALSGLSEATLLDVGCGDGRHIPMFNKLGIKQLICVESSSSVYNIRRRFGEDYKGTLILYIKCNIENLNLVPNSVNVIWALGIINFFEKQKKLISCLMQASDHAIVFGLVSKNKWGGLYASLNVMRTLQKNKLIGVFVYVMSYALSALVVIFARYRKCFFFSNAGFFATLLSKPKPVKAMQLSLLEPFTSPKIYRYSFKYYDEIAKKEGFNKEVVKENFLTDLHCWKKDS
ncbi:class I SAM-dependent methyltransferase [Alphaproteobacteria bacterium]|nr:class I SAM-dependent methyltransferase [Alphaproteobacteria bacterium]